MVQWSGGSRDDTTAGDGRVRKKGRGGGGGWSDHPSADGDPPPPRHHHLVLFQPSYRTLGEGRRESESGGWAVAAAAAVPRHRRRSLPSSPTPPQGGGANCAKRRDQNYLLTIMRNMRYFAILCESHNFPLPPPPATPWQRNRSWATQSLKTAKQKDAEALPGMVERTAAKGRCRNPRVNQEEGQSSRGSERQGSAEGWRRSTPPFAPKQGDKVTPTPSTH